jgi:hypothetical protein
MKTGTLIGLGALGLAAYALMKSGKSTEGSSGGGFSLGGMQLPSFDLKMPDINLGGISLPSLDLDLGGMIGGLTGGTNILDILDIEDRLKGIEGNIPKVVEDAFNKAKETAGIPSLTELLTLKMADNLFNQGKNTAGNLFDKWFKNIFGGGDNGDGDIIDAEYKVVTEPGWGSDPWGQWVNYITGWQEGPGLTLRSLAILNKPVGEGVGARGFLFPWETPAGEGFVSTIENVLMHDQRPRTWRDVYDAAVARGEAEPIDWSRIDNQDKKGVEVSEVMADLEDSSGPSPELPSMNEVQEQALAEKMYQAWVLKSGGL